MARHKATGAEFGSMEWQARNWGYNEAKGRPTVEDIDALMTAMFPNVKFTIEQHSEIQGAADYAYMMRRRHNSAKVETVT